MGRPPKTPAGFDREMADAPEPMRRREFMLRIEAIIFASGAPVTRERLCEAVPATCNIDELLGDIAQELRARPYEIVKVAGGYQYRTRPGYAAVIRGSAPPTGLPLSATEQLILTAIAYFQPVTRMELAEAFGKPVSRDHIGRLRRAGFVTTGPRSPQLGGPFTYVTTKHFLEHHGFESLRELPEFDRLEDAGLLGKMPLHAELKAALGLTDDAGAGDDEGGR
jgi:segregation and condensation protein B